MNVAAVVILSHNPYDVSLLAVSCVLIVPGSSNMVSLTDTLTTAPSRLKAFASKLEGELNDPSSVIIPLFYPP